MESSEVMLKVVAFAKDENARRNASKERNQTTWQPQAIITSQAVTADDCRAVDDYKKQTAIIKSIYTALNMILKTMTWVLLTASAAIRILLYLSLAKTKKQFGVLNHPEYGTSTESIIASRFFP